MVLHTTTAQPCVQDKVQQPTRDCSYETKVPNSEVFCQNYFKFSEMMKVGINVICGSFLCTNTTKKKLCLYTHQLSRPKCFAKKCCSLGLANCTRVKLAVSSPCRHFRDLAKKTPTQKRADKLKKKLKKHIMEKSYYKQLRRIISNDF